MAAPWPVHASLRHFAKSMASPTISALRGSTMPAVTPYGPNSYPVGDREWEYVDVLPVMASSGSTGFWCSLFGDIWSASVTLCLFVKWWPTQKHQILVTSHFSLCHFPLSSPFMPWHHTSQWHVHTSALLHTLFLGKQADRTITVTSHKSGLVLAPWERSGLQKKTRAVPAWNRNNMVIKWVINSVWLLSALLYWVG